MADEAGERPFARLYLSGERFDDGRLPVDSLAEIQRYQAVVLEAARREWRDAHPDEDLPANFDASFGLVIAKVEEGSADVVLERPSIADLDAYFERGRDDFERELLAVLDPTGPVTRAPLFVLPEFQDFGASLGDGEGLQVRPYNKTLSPRVAAITRAEREGVLARRREELAPEIEMVAPEIELPMQGVRRPQIGAVAGRLSELSPDNRSFHIKTLHYGVLKGFYKRVDLTEDLKAVLDNTSKAPVVRIKGQLQFPEGRRPRIWDADDVELLEIDGQPWSRKLVELASLGPDWDGEAPGAEMISFPALDATRDLMLQFAEAGKPLPSIFGTEEGGVSLEWSSKESVATIEIGSEAEFVLYHLPEGSENGSEEETLDFGRALAFGIEVAH